MIDQRLSRDIEVGARAIPRYKTDVVEVDGGGTVRNSRWRFPLFRFEFDIEPGDSEDDTYDVADQTLKEFVSLYHCAGGQAETFLFRHWADYRATNSYIGEGDGTTTAFQLYRTYSVGAVMRQRKITRPVNGTATIYVDGVAVVASVDYTTGIATLNTAPVASTMVTADFDFDLPVRFANDELEMLALGLDLDKAVSIVLVEERE